MIPTTLASLIPDEALLLALPSEQVGLQLLKLASAQLQNGLFSKGSVAGPERLFGQGYGHLPGPYYSGNRAEEVELAVGEGWQWLLNALLIMPAPEPNNSFLRLTRRGRALVKSDAGFDTYVAAAQFPKALLHPQIADEVWLQLAQGKFAVAVFVAFRAVEEAVRRASSFATEEHGVPMIRRAFHKDNGPLTRTTDPEAEKEALAALFAGAIGSYKNPHSHRTVEIEDGREAQEMVLLASHLLRIVDSRSAEPRPSR